MPERKKILISNDDGIHAKGLAELVAVAREFGDVLVVAPDTTRSGMSMAITVELPIRIKKIESVDSYEVGAKTLGIASFYLRAVCQNRNLWGVEDFEEITIRHSKYAASRFAHEAAPALLNFANSSPMPFINGVKAAREKIVARNEEDRSEFLRRRGFSKAETGKIIDAVLAEEGRPPESIFDFVQGITAVARDKSHQDARLDMEAKAKKLLDRAA